MALQNVQIQVETAAVVKLLANLKEIGGKKAINAVRRATSRAGTALLQTMRPLVPIRTGLLKRSMGKKDSKPKVTAYAYSIVGPRKGFRQEIATKAARSRVVRARRQGVIATANKKRIQNPAKYAHLVDRGHQMKNGGFVRGKRFYFAAEIAARQRIENVMKMELQRTLLAEATQPTTDI